MSSLDLQSSIKSDGFAADVEADIARAKTYAMAVRLACDELHHEPFNRPARATLMRLIVDDSPEADAALIRAFADMVGGK